MPIYEFLCRDCNSEQELLVRGAETPVCESCGGEKLMKLLSVPVAHAGGADASPAPGGRPAGGCGGGCACHPH